MKENTNVALSKDKMDILEKLGLDVSDASLIYMGKGQYNVNFFNSNFEEIIKCKLGFYAYTLWDLYRRIEDLTLGTEYYIVIDMYSIQLQYMKNDKVFHEESSNDNECMLETAYNMLVWMLKNILGRKIKE